MRKRYMILAGILAAGMVLSGCGKKDKNVNDTKQENQTTVDPVQQDNTSNDDSNLVNMQQSTEADIKNVIGEKTATATRVVLVNKTGADISSFYVRVTIDDDEEWGSELINGKFTLKNGEKAVYYFDKNTVDGTQQGASQYDVRIAYTDENKSECYFRKLPMNTITQLTLCMDGNGDSSIPYARYMTGTSKKEVSTLQEVRQRLGLDDDGWDTDYDSTASGTDNTDTQPTPEPTQAPEPTPDENGGEGNAQGPIDNPDETPAEDPASVAERYIGQPLDALISACGNPTGNNYVDEPETGSTGYHYYDTFTVSTTVDEDGNEIVAGIW